MSETEVTIERPWERLLELIEAGETTSLLDFLNTMNPMDTALAISRLRVEEQGRLFAMLHPADAAEVIEDIPDTQAVDVIEELSPEQAAAILEELDSDHIADLLGELDEADAQAIIDRMTPEEAEEARQFLEYDPDTAGGLMVSEYLAFAAGQSVQEVLDDFQENREEYADYHVQYLYVTDDAGCLVGVLRMHDLLFPSRSASLRQLMITNPLRLPVDATLEDLRNFFEEHHLFGVPVVDEAGKMIGVVLPEAVEDAKRKRSVHQFLGLSGIIGGEEFRSMPLLQRSGRRLSWLSLNIVLNIIAASVIALYQDTLAAVIALAVFLPMVSDMSGCSGNQAVAVSMRELSLGLVRPNELLRVLGKEAGIGLLNGLVLGVLLGGAAWLWQGNPFLGAVVGGALALNTFVAVAFGGLIPLALKRLKLDPALVSSPLLTTVTDMCGFFFVLSFASLMLDRL
ncbi:MAG: magnesium transporter [Desulfuromonadales bacterium]